MKKVLTLTFAAILGSILTLLAFVGLGLGKTQVIERTVAPTAFTNSPFTAPTPAVSPAVKAMPVDFTNAAARSMPAVVHIKSTVQFASNNRQGNPNGDLFEQFREFFGEDFDPYGGGGRGAPQQASGSGVIISRDGYIVTNNHVVDGATKLEVTTFDNRTLDAELIGTDPTTDLALIKVKDPNLPILEMSNSDNVKVGEWVLAVGNPFDLTSTVTAGIVSAKGRNINILQEQYAIESFIQTDAAVNPGNSGGALVDVNGNLIGINTAIATRTGYYSGYSFAVPVNIVKKVIGDLKEFGEVQRGVLGVSIRNLDTQLADDLGLDISQGVYINGLLEGGSAKEAGVKEGDVIISVNGIAVKTAPELQEQIGRKRPGDVIDVEVMRDGKIKNIDVPLRNRRGTTEVVTTSIKSDELMDRLGVDFETIATSTASKLDLEGGVEILQINEGIIKRNTDIREGFIITKAAGRSIKTSQDLVRALDAQGGIMIEGVYPGDPTVYFYAFGL